MTTPRILITVGEPAGIGPDLVIQAAQNAWPAELLVVSDPELLLARAKQLKLPLNLKAFAENTQAEPQAAQTLKIIPLPLQSACEPGILNRENASTVLQSLELACQKALTKQVDALVTGPVHKGIINEAGFPFLGHTEFFAKEAGVSSVVMLFVTENSRIALATTHLPLAKVPAALTKERLETTLQVLHQGLEQQFGIEKPSIYVCGLNPHAGEGGHLGREEIDIITPVLENLRRQGLDLIGPLSADTMFSEKNLKSAAAILAMYHDQALPVVKYMSFGKAVNVTLGLPFIRTSVDHGTALELAGTGLADAGSLKAALLLALELVRR